MLNIHNLSVSFGGTYLFEEITFRLGAGDRVGLVGKNGAGKSTLLKILARDIAPDTGSIATEKEIRIGFLRQDIDFEHGRTVLEEAYQAFTEIKAVEKKLDHINHQLATRTDYESESYSQLIEDLSDYTHRFELLDGYNYVGNTEKILLGLGFKREDFNNLTETFSGGWRMRIELAKLLLQNNDVLLLDEPLSALDRKMREQMQVELIKLQRQVGITFVLVTHDQEEALVMSDRIAVMFEGQIAQLDGPEALYARPASRRVADFIGVMNFLPTRITAETPDGVEVELPGFGRVEIPARNVSRANPDDEGPTVGFRPEAVSIVSAGAPAQARMSEGTIDEVVYYGDMTYYDVRLDGADAFGVKVPPIRIAMRNVFGREVQEVGARTSVSWSPGSLVLFR